MKKNTLRQILGKADYAKMQEIEIRTIRSIVRKHKELSLWYRVPGGLLTKIRSYLRLVSYDFHYTSKLTDHHIYLAYGRKCSRYDYVDFIHNKHSAYTCF